MKYKIIYDRNGCVGAFSCVIVGAQFWKMAEDNKKKMKAFHQTLNPKVLHDRLLILRKKLFAGAKFTRNDIRYEY